MASNIASTPIVDEAWSAWGDALYGFVLSLVGSASDAEDVVQEVFLSMLRAVRGGSHIRNLRAYLYQCARNESYRFIKRRKLTTHADAEKVILLVEAPQGRAEDAMDLSNALATLPIEQREVAVLKLFHKMTFEEIAELLDISPNTAASRHRYALEKLRRILRPETETLNSSNAKASNAKASTIKTSNTELIDSNTLDMEES